MCNYRNTAFLCSFSTSGDPKVQIETSVLIWSHAPHDKVVVFLCGRPYIELKTNLEVLCLSSIFYWLLCTHFSMDQQNILCNSDSVLWQVYCSLFARSGLIQNLLLPLSEYVLLLDQCRSLSHFFLCLSAGCSSASSSFQSQWVSCVLGLLNALLFFLSHSHPPIPHLLSGVLVSARQGVPGVTFEGNELLITSQETRSWEHPTLLPSPQYMQRTHTKKKKKRVYTAIVCTAHKEKSYWRGRAEVQIKRAQKKVPTHNYKTSRVK